jgi:hypothetical protein
MEIWEPKPPGTLWATPGLLRDPPPLYVEKSSVRSLSVFRQVHNLFHREFSQQCHIVHPLSITSIFSSS